MVSVQYVCTSQSCRGESDHSGNHKTWSLIRQFLNTYWDLTCTREVVFLALQILLRPETLSSSMEGDAQIAFCPLWTTQSGSHLSLTLQPAAFWVLEVEPEVGINPWPMSAVFSVPAPVLVGPSGVLLCVRMRMGTLPTTGWRIKPDEHRACESGPCPQWAYGSWGEVSANSTYTSFGKKQIPNSAVVHSLFEGRRTGSS